MTKNARKFLIAGTFVAAVAAMVFGASKPGETNEHDVCASAVWPMIPATCFGRELPLAVGSVGQPVRNGATRPADEASQSAAFAEKGDLLRRPGSIAAYETVEQRGDGFSVLKRLPIGN